MGVACETALIFSTIFAFYVENTNIHKVELKMSCYIIVIKTDLSGFVITIHSGLYD